jgi:hypothetical protein
MKSIKRLSRLVLWMILLAPAGHAQSEATLAVRVDLPDRQFKEEEVNVVAEPVTLDLEVAQP